MSDIAALYSRAFCEVPCHTCISYDELPDRCVDCNIIVAPYEYYSLYLIPKLRRDQYHGDGLSQRVSEILSQAFFLCIEPPKAETFASILKIAPLCKGILEAHEETMDHWQKLEMPAKHLPLPFSHFASGLGPPLSTRGIDLTFLGTVSKRRMEFFSNHSEVLDSLVTSIHLSRSPRSDLANGRRLLLGQERSELLYQSKLFVNIHANNGDEFDWYRAMLAIAHGCIYVTEESSPTTRLIPEKHLIKVPYHRMADACFEVLKDHEKASSVQQEAYDFLSNHYDPTQAWDNVDKLLAELSTQSAKRTLMEPVPSSKEEAPPIATLNSSSGGEIKVPQSNPYTLEIQRFVPAQRPKTVFDKLKSLLGFTGLKPAVISIRVGRKSGVQSLNRDLKVTHSPCQFSLKPSKTHSAPRQIILSILVGEAFSLPYESRLLIKRSVMGQTQRFGYVIQAGQPLQWFLNWDHTVQSIIFEIDAPVTSTLQVLSASYREMTEQEKASCLLDEIQHIKSHQQTAVVELQQKVDALTSQVQHLGQSLSHKLSKDLSHNLTKNLSHTLSQKLGENLGDMLSNKLTQQLTNNLTQHIAQRQQKQFEEQLPPLLHQMNTILLSRQRCLENQRLENQDQAKGIPLYRSEYGSSFDPKLHCDVSVVIPLYNYQAYIKDAMESVFAAKKSLNIELVIVNDCSTDSSAEVVRSMLESAPINVRLISRRHNRGLAEARNLGISESRGDYIFFLDADNLVLPNGLKKLVEAARANHAPASYGILATLQENGTRERSPLLSQFPWNPRDLIKGNYIDAMALFDRQIFMKIGGYDASLAIKGIQGWEDYDMWLRFASEGLEPIFIPEMIGRYRIHGDSMMNHFEHHKSIVMPLLRNKYSKLWERTMSA